MWLKTETRIDGNNGGYLSVANRLEVIQISRCLLKSLIAVKTADLTLL